MIKTFEFFNELDPYGEENWDDKSILDKCHEIILNIESCFDISNITERFGGIWHRFTFSIDYPHKGILNYEISHNEYAGIFLYCYSSDAIILSGNLKDIDEKYLWDLITELAEKCPKENKIDESNDVFLNFLKNKSITYHTKEEMLNIARKLYTFGFKTYATIEDMEKDGLDYVCFECDEGDKFFGRNRRMYYEELSYDDFMKLMNRKFKTIERPDVDPYGEDDWGYLEESKEEVDPYNEENWDEKEECPNGEHIWSRDYKREEHPNVRPIYYQECLICGKKKRAF